MVMEMPVTPAIEAEIAKLFPHSTNHELALAFGVSRRQVQHIGTRAGLRKTHEALSRARSERHGAGAPTLMSRLEAAAAACGAAGLSLAAAAAALPDERADRLISSLHKLTGLGRLHRGGRKRSSSWFTSAADAAAYTERCQPKAAPAVAPALRGNATVTIAAMPGPAMQAGALHITERTRRTEGPPVPGPEGRWHTNAQRVFGGRIGQYDDPAPRPWVAAITNPSGRA